MSLKEDILEQIVEEYCLHNGYFVRNNIKYKPNMEHKDTESGKDSNYSDIDILAYNPTKTGYNKVWVISCKSWQKGFSPKSEISNIENKKIISGRERWKAFRELVVDKWAKAFTEKIFEETGQSRFTYFTAVTKLIGDKEIWENNRIFRENISNNPIRILTLANMVDDINPKLSDTVASTEIGRLLQLLKAGGVKL